MRRHPERLLVNHRVNIADPDLVRFLVVRMLARVVADGQEQGDFLLHVLQLDVHHKVDDVLFRSVVAHRVDVEVLLVLARRGRVDVAVAGDVNGVTHWGGAN
uniref:(northern house mosquito) hypothetical protein n=1 Tax=Culex pipiens TaxID=7175 RepID=A0A8D8CIT2_CULPI